MPEGILLVGHGSRDPAGNAQFLHLAATLAARAPQWMVEPAFLDHLDPGVLEGADRLIARGVRAVGVVPLFLFAAGHAKRDMPRLLDEARRRHTGVEFRYGRPLGVHSALVQAAVAHLARAEHGAPRRDRAETAVLLVGRGSSDPDANSDLWKMARLIWEESRYGFVECAYSDMTLPRVPEGLARCVRLGARRVILLPYFLFKGVLMQRLRALVTEWQARDPIVELLMAGEEGLGSTPGVIDLALERAGETTFGAL